MPELLVGTTLTLIFAWRTNAAWRAVDPADLDLPNGSRGWPFGSEYYCKAWRCAVAYLAASTSIALHGLADVASSLEGLARPGATALFGVAMVLFVITWNTGKPRSLVPPILRDYDCRSSGRGHARSADQSA